MPARRVVVDGSNIATEGRTTPSLAQLNEAVLAFLNEYPESEVTVVVDATFGHRIDPSEVPDFDAAEANNELVSPPAGAIGRGDAFLLRIAGKIGATVLSNDSFQEFHGEHDWLFDEARLIGGKPIQGIGWIFTPRTPVRGAKSRKSVKDAKQGRSPALQAASSGEALGPAPVPSKPPPRGRRRAGAAADDAAQVADAIAVATAESVTGEEVNGRKRRRKKRGARPAEPVNDSLPFITFIAEHPLGSEVEGEVETFTSHGAFVLAGGARCYVPISALGDPPPRAARDVLNRGGRRTFVVQALDPQRRGIELALPEFAHVAGAPRPETIEAEIREAPAGGIPVAASGRGRRAAPPARLAPAGSTARAGPPPAAPGRPGAATARSPARARLTPPSALPARRARPLPVPAGATAQPPTGGAGDESTKGPPPVDATADKAAKAAKAGAPAAPSRATKATKVKATKVSKAATPAKAPKPAKASKPEKPAKAAKAAKATTPETPAKAVKATKADGKAASRKKAPKPAPRGTTGAPAPANEGATPAKAEPAPANAEPMPAGPGGHAKPSKATKAAKASAAPPADGGPDSVPPRARPRGKAAASSNVDAATRAGLNSAAKPRARASRSTPPPS